ncbi:GerMN domain-containing protein [Nocardioides jishulii]|uniref:GerMN domain-containing protein n=1 Tax=Nocardioides jishulii TaxID=2575440 RepID=A0A4V5TJT2_9ACTN|nr:GerMN domain-containing protein [Nocardioides jishulii]QCX28199.1 hypothetical protein FCL41_12225 [Nocardioides jishulii]TKI60863.1 hypothetical protein FC770_15295 [Nocardioides jishulii]
MTRPYARSRRRFAALLTVLALGVLTACVQMPTEGPLVRVDPQAADEDEGGGFYDPRPPADGADPEEIVLGFLEAMKATPVTTSVASEFLTERAQRTWSPEKGTITYSDFGPAVGFARVRVPLVEAHRYDRRGAWEHRLPDEDATLTFPMAIEGEEWRIDAAPDALVVPESWFDDGFQSASLHFFDPTGTILVPEPVRVPSGDQMATALVRGLLEGAPDRAVSRSAFPAGRLAMNSVPIDDDGVADVVIEDVDGTVDTTSAEEMLAQLTWTLRQVPDVDKVRLTIDDRPVTMADGAREVSVQSSLAFSPLGRDTNRDLFALVDGRLVRGDFENFSTTAGPLGSGLGVRSVGVSLDGTRAVGVTRDGRSAVAAALEKGAPDETFVEGASDLLRPVFDFAGRVWLVDRTPSGARVWVKSGDGDPVEVEVPGVTGEDVTLFLVSRDSSRLVAVIRGPDRDRVVVSRVSHSPDGGRPRLTRARTVTRSAEAARRVTDIAWRSPVTLALLGSVTPDLAQVRLLPVDGSPGERGASAATRVRGEARRLVCSPVEGDGTYVVTGDQILDLAKPSRDLPEPGDGPSWFGFVG